MVQLYRVYGVDRVDRRGQAGARRGRTTGLG